MKKYILPTTILLFVFTLIFSCKKEESGDKNKPFIVLLGYNPTYWPQGESPYVDAGAEAYDVTESGDTVDITDRLKYEDNVNVDVSGDYQAKYNVTDEAGNAADEKKRDVKVLLTK